MCPAPLTPVEVAVLLSESAPRLPLIYALLIAAKLDAAGYRVSRRVHSTGC
jgi:hypothetical protein